MLMIVNNKIQQNLGNFSIFFYSVKSKQFFRLLYVFYDAWVVILAMSSLAYFRDVT